MECIANRKEVSLITVSEAHNWRYIQKLTFNRRVKCSNKRTKLIVVFTGFIARTYDLSHVDR